VLSSLAVDLANQPHVGWCGGSTQGRKIKRFTRRREQSPGPCTFENIAPLRRLNIGEHSRNRKEEVPGNHCFLQTKLDASSVLPVPLYLATRG
jgi:hypothetical protein